MPEEQANMSFQAFLVFVFERSFEKRSGHGMVRVPSFDITLLWGISRSISSAMAPSFKAEKSDVISPTSCVLVVSM